MACAETDAADKENHLRLEISGGGGELGLMDVIDVMHERNWNDVMNLFAGKQQPRIEPIEV